MKKKIHGCETFDSYQGLQMQVIFLQAKQKELYITDIQITLITEATKGGEVLKSKSKRLNLNRKENENHLYLLVDILVS